MDHFSCDAAVIGAGVVGLAVARRLARAGHDVVVLEKNDHIGMETSARNSEVVHAGIYYPQGSLKALLCARGRELLYDFCQSHGVPHKRIGKLVVGHAGQEAQIAAIAAAARDNDVAVQSLDRAAIARPGAGGEGRYRPVLAQHRKSLTAINTCWRCWVT